MRTLRLMAVMLVFVLLLSCNGVWAAWNYYEAPDPTRDEVFMTIEPFVYGNIYITSIKQVGGSHQSASIEKTGETDVKANIVLNSQASSSAVFEVTFYNSTDMSYYYNEAQSVSSNNSNIVHTVSGIEKREEIPPYQYKTLTLSYGFKGSVSQNVSISSELHFNFVVDKDSIGIIVAQSAVTRFDDILNDKLGDETYQALENAMNNRGSNSSSVSFIGNVSGANDNDSKLIQQLFTNEFLTMDLDGDGKSEPITLMIKRENLDGNTNTGDDYTYKSLLGISRTVEGVEFSIYITSEGFDKKTLTVYAATYTKLQGSDEWVQVVELTKGSAEANRYSIGFGGNNSFNTDTWKSDDGKSMDTLTNEGIKNLK